MMFRKTYTFDDVLIEPGLSTLNSRSEVDLSVKLSKGLKFNIPVIPANMKTVVDENVARKMCELKGLCLLHRFWTIEEQLATLITLRKDYEDVFNYVGISVGVKKEDYANVEKFINLGVKIVCIDVAHGHSSKCAEMAFYVSQNWPQVFLIAGNVATGGGAEYLWGAGADAVKVNVGAGSICQTRIEAGVGVPQLSALIDVFNADRKDDEFIIADGGCVKVGDLVKSLCFSDMAMTGNLFAGSFDCPGETVEQNGKQYKRYDGSSTHKSDHIEGVKALVEIKPAIKDIVKGMTDGISSGCSYVGSYNLKQLKQKAKFVEITPNATRENDVTMYSF